MTEIRIRKDGRITLPAGFRQKYGLKEGATLTLTDLGGGNLMFTPGVSNFTRLADKLAEELENAGVKHGYVKDPRDWPYSSYIEWEKRGLYPPDFDWNEPKDVDWGE